MSTELETLERLLRRSRLRVTRPRLAVLGAVHSRPHSDTDTILRTVRTELGQVSHQAVYDVLRALSTAGLVRRIQPLGHVARYEARVADNHHHAVCRSCGVITDVDCAVGAAPCLTPTPVTTTDRGFVVDEAEVIYWGLCPSCARARPHDTRVRLASSASSQTDSDVSTDPPFERTPS